MNVNFQPNAWTSATSANFQNYGSHYQAWLPPTYGSFNSAVSNGTQANSLGNLVSSLNQVFGGLQGFSGQRGGSEPARRMASTKGGSRRVSL